ncbi:MAG: c-type cytochrome [Nitrospinae bacterium]|nr:c-type cytochrome [Nitrospinota bacterium]
MPIFCNRKEVIHLKRYLGLLSLLAFAAVLFSYSFASADAAKGEAIFKDTKVGNCKTCHDTGDKKKVGPGLKGVTDRVAKDVIAKWLEDPQTLWDSGSDYIKDLQKRMNKEGKPKTAMKLPGKLSAEQIADVIDFLATLK